jgi:hypothetical protein
MAGGETSVPPDVEAYYSATLRHIRAQKAKVGPCRLTLSKPVLKAPIVSAL